MSDLNERDTKLVQYLNEAFGKEKELETALQAHIEMTSRAPYKKRLQQHLKETRGHARDVGSHPGAGIDMGDDDDRRRSTPLDDRTDLVERCATAPRRL